LHKGDVELSSLSKLPSPAKPSSTESDAFLSHDAVQIALHNSVGSAHASSTSAPSILLPLANSPSVFSDVGGDTDEEADEHAAERFPISHPMTDGEEGFAMPIAPPSRRRRSGRTPKRQSKTGTPSVASSASSASSPALPSDVDEANTPALHGLHHTTLHVDNEPSSDPSSALSSTEPSTSPSSPIGASSEIKQRPEDQNVDDSASHVSSDASSDWDDEEEDQTKEQGACARWSKWWDQCWRRALFSGHFMDEEQSFGQRLGTQMKKI
jgi:hypothetical protein